MPETIEFSTTRLRLRQWSDGDREPFAAMNADPEVMKYFAGVETRQGSNRVIDIWRAELEERGWSNWAVERMDSGAFIGFVGLSVPRRLTLPFMPCVEIGWRLAKEHWGQGYATEAAKGALRTGFDRIGLPEIVSFTSLVNRPSRAVMERIGMVDTAEDFDHPALPEGSELRRHCLYRISRAQWERDAV
jgi:RimJ/RimL family protein N-acetyltransferase